MYRSVQRWFQTVGAEWSGRLVIGAVMVAIGPVTAFAQGNGSSKLSSGRLQAGSAISDRGSARVSGGAIRTVPSGTIGGTRGSGLRTQSPAPNQRVQPGMGGSRVVIQPPKGSGVSLSGGSKQSSVSPRITVKTGPAGLNSRTILPGKTDSAVIRDMTKTGPVQGKVAVTDGLKKAAAGKLGGVGSPKVAELKGSVPWSKATTGFAEQLKSGKFEKLIQGTVAQKLDLGKQLQQYQKGDLAHKLGLADKLHHNGGWTKHHWSGLISPAYTSHCFKMWYCGPGYFPSHCYYPTWCEWVGWSWWYSCDVVYDPRPRICRPWVYDPCPVWVVWEYPLWVSLPEVACGTWVDVEPAIVESGVDLQLLAVRFVDPGHPEEKVGPRFRTWIRNNSQVAIEQPFNILLMASNSLEPAVGLPQSGVRVTGIEAGETKAVDIRLPIEVNVMGQNSEGQPTPFSHLHVLVDSHREIPETLRTNNGLVIASAEVLPVDPAIFGADSTELPAGQVLHLAGEGFGPEPGQVLVHVSGLELQGEIQGWYDLGIRVKLPRLPLAAQTEAELVIVRGDTAASNPLQLQLTAPVAMR